MDNNTEAEYENYPAFKASILIWKTVPPILLIFGTCGNVLSIVILTGKSIRKSTTALYLIFLTFSDLAVLYTGLLRQWVIYLFEFDVRQVSQIACKVHTWLVYSSLDFSAWLLIAVTLERIIAVTCPYSLKGKCNRHNASILIIGILISVLGLNSHFLYGLVFIRRDGESDMCGYIHTSYGKFMDTSWSWIDLCAFCLIPFTFIVIGNCIILLKVAKSRRKAKSKLVSAKYKTSSNSKDNQHSSMTAILVTLNTVFLLTTLPISVYNIGDAYWSTTEDQRVKARLDLWWAVVNMLMYTNNAVNFLLYSLSGSQFRQEVKRIFCDRNSSNNIKYGCMTPLRVLEAHPEYESRQPGSKLIQYSKQRNNTLDPDILESHAPINSNSDLPDKKSSDALKHDSFLLEDELAEFQHNEDIETFAPVAGNELIRLSYIGDS